MESISSITLAEWIIMFVVFTVVGAAYWLVKDPRRRGMPVGGKACGGCPHYCQINRNCDGTPRSQGSIPEGETIKK